MNFQKKKVKLSNNGIEFEIEVYLKEVAVKNNHKNVKAFCRITGEKVAI